MSGSPQLTGIDHVVMTVRDMDATIGFYERLGLRVERFEATDGSVRQALVGAGFKINLHPAEAPFAPHADTPVPGALDLCFETDAPLADWQAVLGPKVIEGPVARTGARGTISSIYCRDPDGNLIEIAQYA